MLINVIIKDLVRYVITNAPYILIQLLNLGYNNQNWFLNF